MHVREFRGGNRRRRRSARRSRRRGGDGRRSRADGRRCNWQTRAALDPVAGNAVGEVEVQFTLQPSRAISAALDVRWSLRGVPGAPRRRIHSRRPDPGRVSRQSAQKPPRARPPRFAIDFVQLPPSCTSFVWVLSSRPAIVTEPLRSRDVLDMKVFDKADPTERIPDDVASTVSRVHSVPLAAATVFDAGAGRRAEYPAVPAGHDPASPTPP